MFIARMHGRGEQCIPTNILTEMSQAVPYPRVLARLWVGQSGHWKSVLYPSGISTPKVIEGLSEYTEAMTYLYAQEHHTNYNR